MRARRAALAVALATVVAVGAPAVSRGQTATCPHPGRVVPSGAWTSIAAPDFGDSGRAEVTTYVVDPQAPARLLVTNGTSVMRSGDGGCNWDRVYTVSNEP